MYAVEVENLRKEFRPPPRPPARALPGAEGPLVHADPR